LTTVNDDELAREFDEYTDDLMMFNKGNTVLRGLRQRLGAELIDYGSNHA